MACGGERTVPKTCFRRDLGQGRQTRIQVERLSHSASYHTAWCQDTRWGQSHLYRQSTPRSGLCAASVHTRGSQAHRFLVLATRAPGTTEPLSSSQNKINHSGFVARRCRPEREANPTRSRVCQNIYTESCGLISAAKYKPKQTAKAIITNFRATSAALRRVTMRTPTPKRHKETTERWEKKTARHHTPDVVFQCDHNQEGQVPKEAESADEGNQQELVLFPQQVKAREEARQAFQQEEQSDEEDRSREKSEDINHRTQVVGGRGATQQNSILGCADTRNCRKALTGKRLR